MSNPLLPSNDAPEPAAVAQEPTYIGIASDPSASKPTLTPEPPPSDSSPDVKAVSAGGLVFRQSGSHIETLLCARAKPGYRGPDAPLTWRLPKGTPEDGETTAETAQREVREETGIHANVLAPITSIRYFFIGHDDGVHYDKTVHFYLMEPRGGSTSDHDSEFDIVEWRAYEQALELLEYDNERNVLAAARPLIATYGRTAHHEQE